MVEAFPWDRLAPASWAESAVAAWIEGIGARWVRTVTDDAEVARRLREPSAARLGVRIGGDAGVAIAPWPLWRAIRAAVLGEDDELLAPRPPTPVERALAAVAIASALGPDAAIDLADEPARSVRLLVELAVASPVAGELAIGLARAPSPPARPLDALVRARGARLPWVAATLVLARGALRGPVADLRAHDVILVGPAAPELQIAAGAIRVALDPTGAGLIVQAPYRRTSAMPTDGHDDLARDLTVPLTIAIADVPVSARQLLELTPGQVLATGRPVGASVEVRAGARVVARGELVTVDGVLGVRVTELVDATPPVVVPATR